MYAFTRPGDAEAQAFARATRAAPGPAAPRRPARELDAAIIFAPVGALVPEALARVRKGGTVVLGGIHMSDIPSMPYALLWGERVRALGRQPHARQTAEAFLALAADDSDPHACRCRSRWAPRTRRWRNCGREADGRGGAGPGRPSVADEAPGPQNVVL